MRIRFLNVTMSKECKEKNEQCACVVKNVGDHKSRKEASVCRVDGTSYAGGWQEYATGRGPFACMVTIWTGSE